MTFKVIVGDLECVHNCKAENLVIGKDSSYVASVILTLLRNIEFDQEFYFEKSMQKEG